MNPYRFAFAAPRSSGAGGVIHACAGFGIRMRSLIILFAVAPSAWACASVGTAMSDRAAAPCNGPSVEDLMRTPSRYGGKWICATGYLGRMEPYGEDSAKLYATREEADATEPNYAHIGIPLAMESQKRLSGYSAQPIEVRGTFSFWPDCWPRPGKEAPAPQCFGHSALRISGARITLPDGAVMP